MHNMVIEYLIEINQHANKRCCVSETSSEVYRFKIYIVLDNNPNHFEWYGKHPIIHEVIAFGCKIYPITSKPNKLNYRTQEVSLIGYTNIRETLKWQYPHTKKLKYG